MSIFDSPLIQDQITSCCFMNKVIANDGYGGFKTVWTEGATFDAVITENSSIEAAIAGLTEQQTFYGVKVRRIVPLEHHSVFKRISDGKLFRIRRSDALNAPSFSALDMKTLDAEEFEFTSDDTIDEDEDENNGGNE